MDTLREILKHERKSLRYYASDLGALTGYHPYADVLALFDRYLYQDLALLRDIDAKTLGVSFVSAEEEVDEIVSKKLTSKQQAMLHNVQAALQNKQQLQSQAQAKKLIEHIDLVIQKELQSNVDLTKEDIELLEQELKGRVRKQYGVNCEEDALNRYEDEMGFPVVERNSQLYVLEVLPLQQSSSNGPVLSRTTPASSSSCDATQIVAPHADSGPHGSTTLQKTVSAKKRNNDDDDDTTTSTNEKKKQNTLDPAFSIVGRVDGISYQMDTSSEDFQRWTQTKVVVEMKNRVRRISKPPPLYEQIQLVAYMIMTDSVHGDLVQSMTAAPRSVQPADSTATSAAVIASADRNSMTRSSESSGKVTKGEEKAEKGILSTVIDLSRDDEGGEVAEASTVVLPRLDEDIAVAEDDEPPLVVSVVATESISLVDAPAGIPTNAIVMTTSSANDNNNHKSDTKQHATSAETFSISRVSLDGPPYDHRHHWDQVIIPRLHHFRQAILTLRQDDSLRYQFLLASEEEKMAIIASLCPYYQF